MDSPPHDSAIWCVLDSRPGHRNQVLGLASALQRRSKAIVEELHVRGLVHGIRSGFGRRRSLPTHSPNLIIGAGHSTHMPLLQLGLRFRANTVVLMKPSFPFWLFDLCVIPDVYSFRQVPDNLFLTTGVLNRIRPSDTQDSGSGMFLVGGPSDHHAWSDDNALRQILEVIRRCPSVSWQMATSRRTPASFVEKLREQDSVHSVVSPEDVSSNWLPEQLARCGTVWVTEDSVSMIYEAVTSGARTGVIELTRTRNNRATLCVDRLFQSKDVTSWTDFNRTGCIYEPSRRISEADRSAEEILRRGLLKTASPDTARRAA